MAVKFANNVSTTLSSAINATQTTISVADASGLPSLSSGDYIYLTIDTDTASPTLEVVKVTAVSSNDLTVVRGQDGTTASSFSAGVKVELRVTAAALGDISSQAQTAADTESVSIAGDTMTGSLNMGDNDITDVNQLFFDSGVKFKNSTDSQVHFQSANSGAVAMEFKTSDSTRRGLVYGNSSNQFGLLDSDYNWFIRHTRDIRTDFLVNNVFKARIDDDKFYHVGQVRAPIFYDYDDTSYYLDADNTGTSLRVAGNIVSGDISSGDISSGKITASKSTSHTTGTISHTHAAIDLYNPLQSDTDEKGAILTFSDNYYDGNYVKTTRAAIKGGTDSTGNTANGFLAFYTDSSGANSAVERMRITHGGTVGINKSTPNSNSKLHVDGHVYIDTGHGLYTDNVLPYSTYTVTYGSSVANGIHNFKGRIQSNGTTVLTSGRALENVTSISSGEITVTSGNDVEALALIRGSASSDQVAISFIAGGTKRYIGKGTDGHPYWSSSSNISANGSKIWHAGNDGANSGLDSDKLDGQHGSYYLNYSNFTNTPTIPTLNDTLDSVTDRGATTTNDISVGRITSTTTEVTGQSTTSAGETHTVGLIVARDVPIVSKDSGGYLRAMLRHRTNNNLEIGQGGTSLINDIGLYPGSSGNVNFYTNNSSGTPVIKARVNSAGNLDAVNFRDLNDTSYLADPASVSNFNKIKAKNIPYGNTSHSNYGTQNTFGTDGGVGADALRWSTFFRDNNDEFLALGVHINHPTNVNYALQFGSTSYSAGSGSFQFRALSNNTWTTPLVVIDTGTTDQTKSGRLRSTVDMRAPTFYSQTNSAYMVSPHGTSKLAQLYVDEYIRHNNDTDTYIQFLGNSVGFTTGGTQRMRVTNDAIDLYTRLDTKTYTATAADDFNELIQANSLSISSHAYSGQQYTRFYHGSWAGTYYFNSGSSTGEKENVRIFSHGNSQSSSKIEINDGTAWRRVLTESDKSSMALTGTPTAPTATAGTDTTQIATTAFVTTAIDNIVDAAPGSLDTLNELAAALGDDANFSTTVTDSIATKLPKAGGTMTGNINMGTNRVELGNVDLYASGDNNSLHIHAPTAVIPPSTTTTNNPHLGTSTYRWRSVNAGTANFSGLILAENGIRVGTGDHVTDGRATISFGEGTTTGDSMYIEYDGENLSGANNAIIIGSTDGSVGDIFRVTYGGDVKIGSNDVFHDGYHPNADRWTTGRTHTINLTGQVTGSASQTVDGSGNKTWNISTTLNDSALDDQYVTFGARHQGDGDDLIVQSRASVTIWDVSEASDNPSNTYDGLVLSAGWDSSAWGIQQYHDFHTNDLYLRAKNNGSMTSWERVFHDTYHPNADKWTTARTITLGGDLSGSVSLDGSANVTLSAQVANDSHTHDTRYAQLSANNTFTGNNTFNGTVYGIYHAVEEDHYYFDSYSGTRNVNAFLKTSRSDIIKYRDVSNVEYWNGTSWVDGSSQLANVKNLLDGRQDTSWSVPSTYYKFRFTVTASTSWPTTALIGTQTSWSGSTYPGFQMLVEELQTDNTWTTKVTADFTSSNGVSNWGTAFKADSALHTGRGSQSHSTRITIDFYGWTPSNSSYTTIPLQNIFIYSNFAGLENNDYSNLLNYARNINAPNDIYLPGRIYHTSDTDTYFAFDSNRIRLVAGNTTKFDSNNTYLTTTSTLDGSNIGTGTIPEARLPTQSKYLRSDADDTTSGYISFSNQDDGVQFTHVANSATPSHLTSGNRITGGSDYAGLSKLNNVAVQTWFGFSVSPTISNYTVAQGDPAFSVDARYGIAYAAQSMRSKVFYDTDDTNYYADPAGMSELKDLRTGKNHHTNSPRWDTSFYVAQSQHWYGHSASQTMYLGESANHVRLRGYLNIGSDANVNTNMRLTVRGHADATDSLRAPIFYDTNNTGYYSDPQSTSRLNVVYANAYGQQSNSTVKIAFPDGGSRNGNGSETGAIKIRLPQSWTNTMMTMTVRVYDYTTNESFEVKLGGYNHTSGSLHNGSWHNCFAWIDTNVAKDRNFTVRFGHDGTRCCIQIGETGSTWSYLKVMVVDFCAGHSAATVQNWENSWEVSLVTSNIATANGGASISQTDRNRYMRIMYDSDNTGYYLNPQSTSNFYALNVGGSAVWTSGNDGAGSGLHADLLDGYHGSHYLNYNNLTNKPTIPTSLPANGGNADTVDSLHAHQFIRSDAADTATGLITFSGGINGFTLQNGISGSNFNITGVNQLQINDPGEGIVFGGGSNTVTLYAIDDSTDNNMNFSGANQLQVNGRRVFEANYHPNADKWTTPRSHTVTLTGEVTGTATQSVDGTGNKTWSIATTINNNSLNDQYVQRLSDGSSPDYQTPSSRRVNPTTSNPTNEHYAITTYGNGGNVTGQLATHFQTGATYNRAYNTSWSAWSRMFDDDYHPNADRWTTSRALTLSGDVTGSVSFNGSQNVTMVTTVGNDTHTHSKITERSNISFGSGMLQWCDHSGNGGTGGNNNAPANPFSDWHHHLIMNHSNSGGYYVDMAFSFHSDRLHFRRMVNGTLNAAQEIFHDGYHPNADKWTTARTLTLSGDVTGSVSFDGSANATITTDLPRIPNSTEFGSSGNAARLLFSAGGNSGSRNYFAPRNAANNGWRWDHEFGYDHGQGRWYFDAEVRAATVRSSNPFYGTNNSSYYLDPDSNSRLANVIADGWKVSGAGTKHKFYDGSGDIEMTIDASGNVVARGNVTAYGSTSDIRLKENIETIPDALEKVQKLDGVTFDYKKDGTRSTGLIAQQLQEVLPEVVYETTDVDDEESHLAVRYGNVVGLLVEAIKEQSAQIDALRAQIDSLEEKIK